eukprot:1558627-Amphidinium_carterae.1
MTTSQQVTSTVMLNHPTLDPPETNNFKDPQNCGEMGRQCISKLDRRWEKRAIGNSLSTEVVCTPILLVFNLLEVMGATSPDKQH